MLRCKICAGKILVQAPVWDLILKQPVSDCSTGLAPLRYKMESHNGLRRYILDAPVRDDPGMWSPQLSHPFDLLFSAVWSRSLQYRNRRSFAFLRSLTFCFLALRSLAFKLRLFVLCFIFWPCDSSFSFSGRRNHSPSSYDHSFPVLFLFFVCLFVCCCCFFRTIACL